MIKNQYIFIASYQLLKYNNGLVKDLCFHVSLILA